MRETLLDRYGVTSSSRHESFNEKRIETCMKKWGVDHNVKSFEVWRKNHESKKKNGSFVRSKIESMFISDLRKIFRIVNDQIVIDTGIVDG
jgi:predicted SpoU family rRNA methylase